ncbi:hypothetical protein ABZS86_02390 [Streptomyces sp. NPDC005355]|uniref:hypothetical protein n=1 Tax=Streptomyces sp. NPDC005355 TaxID=3157038 RepID=UPI0033A99E85
MPKATARPLRPDPDWRIDRIPGRPAYRTDDGRVALPLWLAQDGKHVADVELMLTPGEAEQLHQALAELAPSEGASR